MDINTRRYKHFTLMRYVAVLTAIFLSSACTSKTLISAAHCRTPLEEKDRVAVSYQCPELLGIFVDTARTATEIPEPEMK